jgi:hypothetical protein
MKTLVRFVVVGDNYIAINELSSSEMESDC